MKHRKEKYVIGTGLLFLLFAIVPILTGCGKKGPPVAPRQAPLPVISDLTAAVENDAVRLWWTLPKSSGQAAAVAAGFFVSRSKTALSVADCEDCPLMFERIADIPLRGELAGEKKWEYQESVEKGYRYIYQVTVYNRDGDEGPNSNPAEFIY